MIKNLNLIFTSNLFVTTLMKVKCMDKITFNALKSNHEMGPKFSGFS